MVLPLFNLSESLDSLLDFADDFASVPQRLSKQIAAEGVDVAVLQSHFRHADAFAKCASGHNRNADFVPKTIAFDFYELFGHGYFPSP